MGCPSVSLCRSHHKMPLVVHGLISPTCNMWSLQGANKMRNKITANLHLFNRSLHLILSICTSFVLRARGIVSAIYWVLFYLANIYWKEPCKLWRLSHKIRRIKQHKSLHTLYMDVGSNFKSSGVCENSLTTRRKVKTNITNILHLVKILNCLQITLLSFSQACLYLHGSVTSWPHEWYYINSC